MAKTKTAEKAKKPSHSVTKTTSTERVTEANVGAGKAAAGTKTKGKADKYDAPSHEAVPAAQESAVMTATVVSAQIAVETIAMEDEEIILTDAEGRRYCRATDCDQIGIVDGYCRYHYLYLWKKIQVRKKILADGKLDRYIEELTSRYVDKFVELLRKDLRTEKDFLAAVQELELDGSADQGSGDDDESKTYIEEISGVGAESVRDDDGY